MVTADTRTYVNADGDTVEASPHEYVTMYKSQGYVLQREVAEEEVSNPDVDTSEIEAPAINAPIETAPLEVNTEAQPERRRDRQRG